MIGLKLVEESYDDRPKEESLSWSKSMVFDPSNRGLKLLKEVIISTPFKSTIKPSQVEKTIRLLNRLRKKNSSFHF